MYFFFVKTFFDSLTYKTTFEIIFVVFLLKGNKDKRF